MIASLTSAHVIIPKQSSVFHKNNNIYQILGFADATVLDNLTIDHPRLRILR